MTMLSGRENMPHMLPASGNKAAKHACESHITHVQAVRAQLLDAVGDPHEQPEPQQCSSLLTSQSEFPQFRNDQSHRILGPNSINAMLMNFLTLCQNDHLFALSLLESCKSRCTASY